MRFACCAALLFFLALPALAADESFTIDPAHAKVTFLLEATGHDVDGTFDLRRCEVRFDPATGAASGEIALDAATSTTFNKKRDANMHDKVLLSGAHPEIVFQPQHFDGHLPDSGPADVRLDGQVDIAGGKHPLAILAHVERTADSLHVKATFDVPFVEWGLHDPSVMFLKVGKVVHLTIEGDGALAAPAVAAPAAAAAGQGP